MTDGVELKFSGEIWEWRGPAPYYFVSVPEDESLELRAMAGVLSYGWGCIPVHARVGDTTWRTSLMPKDGRYVVPLKDVVRQTEGLHDGEHITVHLTTEGAV